MTSLLTKAATALGGLWPRYGWGWGRSRLLLPSARFDWAREAGEPWRNSTAALGLAWLGDRFPRPRVALSKLARNGDHNPVGRHPVIDLWERPNPHYTRRTMEKAIGLSLKVDGNSYVYKVRDRANRVVQLWWLPHFRVIPTWASDGSEFIGGYLVEVDGRPWPIPPEDIIHFRDGIDPIDERKGLSALKSTLREVCTLNLAAGYTAALLKNSGVPGLAIIPDGETPPRPDKDAAQGIKDKFIERFSGDLAGSPIVMTGRYKLVEVGFSPEKMALRNLTTEARMQVAASLGVALMSLGLEDPNKTYANLSEANRTSWGTVVSIQELIAEGVRFGLLTEPIAAASGATSPGLDPLAYRFDYDYSDIQELQESLDAVHTRTRQDFRFDIISRNEAREQLGYEPDPTDKGDMYFSEVQGASAGIGPGAKPPTDSAPTDTAPGTRTPSDGTTTPADRTAEDNPNKSLVPDGHANGHAARWEY